MLTYPDVDPNWYKANTDSIQIRWLEVDKCEFNKKQLSKY